MMSLGMERNLSHIEAENIWNITEMILFNKTTRKPGLLNMFFI